MNHRKGCHRIITYGRWDIKSHSRQNVTHNEFEYDFDYSKLQVRMYNIIRLKRHF